MSTAFFAIKSVDEARREVGGLITCEQVDKDGETLNYARSKPHFEAWSDEASNATKGAGQDVSYGNLREQHSKRTVGKFSEPLKFDDKEKTIWGCAKVVDDDVWDKVRQGIYTGFSVGGSLDGPMIRSGKAKLITIIPREVSLVDNPAVESAHFDFVRAVDGQVIKTAFVKKTAAQYWADAQAALDSLRLVLKFGTEEGDPDPAFAPDAVPDQGLVTSQPPTDDQERDLDMARHETDGQPAMGKPDLSTAFKPNESNDVVDDLAGKAAKTQLSKTTTGATKLMANEIQKAARTSLHGHLDNLLQHADKCKAAMDAAHAGISECVGKCKAAMGPAFDADEEREGGQPASGDATGATETEVKAVKAEIEKLAATVAELTEKLSKAGTEKAAAATKVVGDRSKAQPTGEQLVAKAAADRKEAEADLELAKAAFGVDPKTGARQQADPAAMDALYAKVAKRGPVPQTAKA